MPAFNESIFIREAVASVALEAASNNLELIAVDDFSTDSTWEILQLLKKEYDFLKVYKNQVKGKNSAFNLAYTKATGDIVVLLAADDTLVPGVLKKRIEPLIDRNDFSITYCKLKTFSNIKKLDSIVTPKDKNLGSSSGGAMAITRVFSDRIFPIPETLANEDMWINCHVQYNNNVEIIHIPVVGLNYRLHENNSLKRNVGFTVASTQIHKRSIVYSVFLEQYRTELTDSYLDDLARRSALEQLRWDGSVLSILFFKGISVREKLRAFIYSNNFSYSIYSYLYRWLTLG